MWISHLGVNNSLSVSKLLSKGVNKSVQFTIFACLKIATFCFYVWSNLASYKMVQDYFICRALFDAGNKTQGFAQVFESILFTTELRASSVISIFKTSVLLT